MGNELIGLSTWAGGELLYKCGKELPGYIKCGEFLDWRRISLLVSQEGLLLRGVN
jgi:hypothetical protein